jgi:hypothetical protein
MPARRVCDDTPGEFFSEQLEQSYEDVPEPLPGVVDPLALENSGMLKNNLRIAALVIVIAAYCAACIYVVQAVVSVDMSRELHRVLTSVCDNSEAVPRYVGWITRGRTWSHHLL